MLFAKLTSDFSGELIVGGGPFREPPTVIQSTIYINLVYKPLDSNQSNISIIALRLSTFFNIINYLIIFFILTIKYTK